MVVSSSLSYLKPKRAVNLTCESEHLKSRDNVSLGSLMVGLLT